MKNEMLLLVFLCASLCFGCRHRAGESSRVVTPSPQLASNTSAELREINDPKILYDTYSFYSAGYHMDSSEGGRIILQKILHVLQICYEERDKSYDVKTADRGTINVAPPRVPGQPPYLGGVAPESIEEPEIRKAYIEKMAVNKRKCEKYNRESSLEGTLDRGIREVRAGIDSFPKDSDDRKIIIATIEHTITNKILRARFLDGIISAQDARRQQ